MPSAPSQPPYRIQAGFQTDFPYGPLAQMGMVNPFFYHLVSDDFDQEIAESGYTKTTSGNGTIALTAGDGGRALFTTNSSTPAAGDVASLQLPAAGFSFTAGKKSFYLARLQVADSTNAAFLVGLGATSATPFTFTDGLAFFKATGAKTLILRSSVGGVNTDLAIPAVANPLADATDIDLGFYVDRNQNVYAFVGSQLVGFIPQSGSGVQTPPVAGPVAAFQPGLTAAVLNPTFAVQSGTASSKTMNGDFWLASKER